MNFPENLRYTKEHEWLSSQEGEAKVGVSQYALEQLGDIVFVELPQVGSQVSAGESFGTIESTKTVSDLYAPSSGEVLAINEKIVSSPESLQEDPYNSGWLVKLKLSEEAPKDLMSSEEYMKFISEEED